jgi:hypothetical protein
MEKENSIYRALLERYEHVVSEQYFINQDNTITNIDIGLLGDINYYIQVKHGNSVNTTQALKAFCYDCMILDKRPNIKIWYSEFPINDKAFHNICRRENIAICKDFDSLIQLIILPKKKQNQVQLRDYQIKAIENVLNNTQLSGIIVFPPVCGPNYCYGASYNITTRFGKTTRVDDAQLCKESIPSKVDCWTNVVSGEMTVRPLRERKISDALLIISAIIAAIAEFGLVALAVAIKKKFYGPRDKEYEMTKI